jgi:hypothetical protein
MRRSRHKLQVSTFPFLAVLLCAMGALILLLLVMDRRGKLVAQSKAKDAMATAVADRTKEDAARKAEWEKQRDALHEMLMAQKLHLEGEASQIDKQLLEAGRKLDLKRDEHERLKQLAALQGIRLAQHQAQLGSQQAGLNESEKTEGTARKDVERLAIEIAELVRTVEELRSLKKRDQQTYSLVPYRGKKGETRKPIYVECVRDGVIFHPQRRALAGPAFNTLELRGEVERRAGGLEREPKKGKEPAEPASPRAPYVLFLIRPDGIGSYYESLGFLKGFQIDFGYEMVDAQWALDFGEPITLAVGSPSVTPPSPVVKSTPGEPTPLPAIGAGQGGSGAAGTGSVAGPTPLASPQPKPLGPGTGTGLGGDPPHGPLTLGPPSAAPVGGGGSSPNELQGSSGKVPPPEPLVKAGPGLPFGGVAADRPPASGGQSTIKQPNAAANVPQGSKDGLPSPWNVPGSGVTPPSSPASADGSAPPWKAAPTNAPSAGNSPAMGIPGATNTKPPNPPPLANVVGNRDFVITIVCHNDHVTVYPGGQQHFWTETNAAAADKALVQNVQGLIAGRQKSVRPGEPSYRPSIRFQLAPGGLIRYLSIYPRLEPLHVPMTRENLDD